MSLHSLAQHLQQAGRGQDKVLVHMTPGEVGGLQQLAMAHGGSLTINPQTGLPEAGILSSLLPTILGFALGPAGFGLMSATQAGLLTGAVSTLATGSLSKGIMAGLGAYGGAGLGEALAGAGGAVAGSLADDALSASGVLKGSGMTAEQVAKQVASAQPGALTSQGGTTLAKAATMPDLNLLKSNIAAKPSFTGMTQGVPGAMIPVEAQKAGIFGRVGDLVGGTTGAAPSIAQTASRSPAVLEGLKNVTSSPEKLWSFVKENPYALAGVASSISAGMQEDPRFPEQKKGKPLEMLRYAYDMPTGAVGTAERNYFSNARFEPTGQVYAKSGGLMAG